MFFERFFKKYKNEEVKPITKEKRKITIDDIVCFSVDGGVFWEYMDISELGCRSATEVVSIFMEEIGIDVLVGIK